MHNGLKKFLEKWCRMRGVPKPQGWEMGLGSSWVIACEKWNASSCLGNFAQTEPQDLELFQVRIQNLATSLFISHRVPWLRLIPCRFSINTYQQLCWSSAGALGGFSFIFFRHSFCFEHLVYTDSTKQGFIHLSNFLINYVYSDKLEALSSAFFIYFFSFSQLPWHYTERQGEALGSSHLKKHRCHMKIEAENSEGDVEIPFLLNLPSCGGSCAKHQI